MTLVFLAIAVMAQVFSFLMAFANGALVEQGKDDGPIIGVLALCSAICAFALAYMAGATDA